MTQTNVKTPRADREVFQGASGDTMNSPSVQSTSSVQASAGRKS
jgi:hypothetical protein